MSPPKIVFLIFLSYNTTALMVHLVYEYNYSKPISMQIIVDNLVSIVVRVWTESEKCIPVFC
jgi:hypothetical protein